MPKFPNNEFVYHDGFYTTEERGHVIHHTNLETGFKFLTKRDLVSDIAFIIPRSGYTQQQLVSAVAGFTANFCIWDWKRLNGFQGFDCIRWKVIEEETLNKAITGPNITNEDVYNTLLELTDAA